MFATTEANIRRLKKLYAIHEGNFMKTIVLVKPHILKLGRVMCKNTIFVRPRSSLLCTINSKPKCNCAISNDFFGALVQVKVNIGFHTISQNLGRVLKQHEQIK